jgi:hypothetical protein
MSYEDYQKVVKRLEEIEPEILAISNLSDLDRQKTYGDQGVSASLREYVSLVKQLA